MPANTHYQTLGLSSKATDAVIRSRYLELSKRFHSDEKMDFNAIHTAYTVLIDPVKRAAYDAALQKNMKQLSFSVQCIPKGYEQKSESTALVALHSYGLLDILKNAKVTPDQLFQQAISHRELANAILHDADMLNFLSHEQYQKLMLAVNTTAPSIPNEQTYKTNFITHSSSNKPIQSEIKHEENYRTRYQNALTSPEAALELLSDKNAMNQLWNRNNVLFNLANISLSHFCLAIAVRNADIVLRKKELDYFLRHYHIKPNQLPASTLKTNYLYFLALENALQQTHPNIQRILITLNLISLNEDDFIDYYVKYPLFKNLVLTHPPLVFKSCLYMIFNNPIFYEDELSTVLLQNPAIIDKYGYFTDNMVNKSIHHCKKILRSALKQKFSGQELNHLIQKYGLDIALVIDEDPELSQTLSAYHIYKQVLLHNFASLTDASNTTLQEINSADTLFQKGEIYNNEKTLVLAAKYYYQAACREHELALKQLMNMRHLLTPHYLFALAKLYGDRSLTFFNQEQSVALYGEFIFAKQSNDIDDEEIISAIMQITDYVKLLISSDLRVNLNNVSGFCLLDAQFKILNYQSDQSPLLESFARALTQICFMRNDYARMCEYIYTFKDTWNDQDIAQLCEHVSAELDKLKNKMHVDVEHSQAFAKLQTDILHCVRHIKDDTSPSLILTIKNILLESPRIILAGYLQDKILFPSSRPLISQMNLTELYSLVRQFSVFGHKAFQEAALLICSESEKQRVNYLCSHYSSTFMDDAILGFIDEPNKAKQFEFFYDNVPAKILLARFHHNKIIEELIHHGADFNLIDPDTQQPVLHKNYDKQKSDLARKISRDELSLYAVAAIRIDALHGYRKAQDLINRFTPGSRCQRFFEFLQTQDEVRQTLAGIHTYIQTIRNQAEVFSRHSFGLEVSSTLLYLCSLLNASVDRSHISIFIKTNSPADVKTHLATIMQSHQELIHHYANEAEITGLDKVGIFILNFLSVPTVAIPLARKYYYGSFFQHPVSSAPFLRQCEKDIKKLAETKNEVSTNLSVMP